jgi:hypothetical protein
MRTFTPAILAIAALGLATSALAQQSVNGPNQQPNIPPALGDGHPANYFGATPSREELYARRIATLRDKMRKITAEDGGQLTPDHAADLQKALDSLNRQFGVKVASR